MTCYCKNNLFIGIEEDEGDHHEIVGRPADNEGGHDDERNPERFHLGSLEDAPALKVRRIVMMVIAICASPACPSPIVLT